MHGPDPIATLCELCARVGFDLDRVGPAMLDRLRLLARKTNTVDDMERIAGYAFEVFRHYDATKPHAAFGEVERRIVVLGGVFADVGKTGPSSAAPAARELIAEMFAIEGVRDERQTVASFMTEHFPEDAGARIARFEAIGLPSSMNMRTFWNQHARWTLEILDGTEVPPEVVAAAAAHHRLDGINPGSIVGDDDRFTREFGANVAFDRAEKLIVVLDKYDAARRRSGRSHADAIAWMRERLERNERYRDDVELTTLIGDLEVVLGDGA